VLLASPWNIDRITTDVFSAMTYELAKSVNLKDGKALGLGNAMGANVYLPGATARGTILDGGQQQQQ
jgi:hypothetical protein